MTLITHRLLRPLLVGVFLAGALSAHGQWVFPHGIDYLHYVPDVPGTPSGRLYIGDGATGQSLCHYRVDLAASSGKLKKWELLLDNKDGFNLIFVQTTTGQGKIDVFSLRAFKRFDANGFPCPEGGGIVLRDGEEGEGDAPVTISVSNTAHAFATTCDGRYTVAVGHAGGASPVPISLIDVKAGREVDTLDSPGLGRSVAACDDGESVLVVVDNSAGSSSSLWRLRVVEGQLVDTGERLSLPSGFIFKTFAVPGSRVGVALAGGGSAITTFRIPGLQVLDSTPAASPLEASAAVACSGDRIYRRGRDSFSDQIHGYSLDPVTGAIGDTPFLTLAVPTTVQATTTYGDALAISRDGTRLIVPEAAGRTNSPPTHRTTYYDATTGAALGFFDSFGQGAAEPELVTTYSCCAPMPLRLEIQRLASGLIQLTSSGEVGRNYELQKSQNLIDWDRLLQFRMTDSPDLHSDPDSERDPARFYRLLLIP